MPDHRRAYSPGGTVFLALVRQSINNGVNIKCIVLVGLEMSNHPLLKMDISQLSVAERIQLAEDL
jgi:hypothetical protein